jgi:hypothetical protein
LFVSDGLFYISHSSFLLRNNYFWKMKKLILSNIFILAGFLAEAQYFQTGQDPASIRWRQIQTTNFQIIYPDYFEEQAQKLAAKLEAIYPLGGFSLGHNPQKFPVILHTQTVKSNGLVAWAPKRAEFYTTPHQSIYPQDWLEQLALHEFRHVVQVDKVNSNLPWWTRFLLGEQVTALLFGAYLPWWLIEGDAVVTETVFSNYGRGRFPSFLMEHKAQVLENGIFSYDKAYFGSFRDFVPNHYKLGYYLAGNIRARHGSGIWEEVLTRAGEKPFAIFPMRQILKKQTGLNTVQNYYSVFDSLQIVWRRSDIEFNPVQFDVITEPGKFYTGYNHNYWLNDTVLLSFKTAYNKIPSFVKIGINGEENHVVSPGIVFSESVNYRGEWIIWSEQIADPRWQHSGRSLIKLYHSQTKKRIQIRPEYKAFSPAVSPDETKVAVVETDFSNNYFLSVYSLPGGELLHRFQSPQNNYFFTPEWLDNHKVATVILTKNGKKLAEVDFQSDKMNVIHLPELGEIKHLRASGDWLYFISSYSGKNSLYRIHLTQQNIEQVFEPRFGAESPAISPNGKTIAVSDYTANGFRLISIPSHHQKVVPIGKVNPAYYQLAETLKQQEPGLPVFSDSITELYPSEKYSKTAHLLNFHSWAPIHIDAANYEFYPGFSLMSQNRLGTAETVLGYKWDHAENTGRFVADYIFRGWYPVFDFNFSHGNRASRFTQINQTVNNQGEVISQDTITTRFSWGQTNAGLNIRLPLVLGRGPLNRVIQPELQYAFNYYKRQESTPERFHTGSFHSLGYRFYFHQVLRQSYLDMYPDFGFILDGTFRHSPAGMLRAGQMFAVESVLYLPGIMKNHGIRIFAGAQQKESNGTLGFSDVVRYARGWGRIPTTSVYTGGSDYKLPLFYPDLNIMGLLYVRRVKASIFADYTRLKGNFYQNGSVAGTFTTDISSVGTELTADVNIMRFYAPSTIGFRTSYLPLKKNVYFDFLFSIDFTSF